MGIVTELLHRFGIALLQLFMNPFYYIGIVFVILQYRKQIQLERKLFSTRLHSLLNETWRTVLWGWAGGMLLSLLMLFAGISLNTDTIVVLWAIAFVLVLVRVRFLCMAYAVGILGIAHTIVSWIPDAGHMPGIGGLLGVIAKADMPSLLAIVGGLHLLEGLLVSRQGARMATPLFMEGKRGKIVGGYQLQGFWPVPLFAAVPFAGGSLESLPWGTWLGADLSAGWSILAFPAMIGFTEMTLSKLPTDKVKESSRLLIVYSLIIIGCAALAHFWFPMVAVAALLAIGLHEGLLFYNRWLESKHAPLFVHSQRGLMILAVVPGGPAAELGIQAGEMIHKVNGHKVLSKTDLHYAMQLNSAFCKLEVINLQGEIKFLQRAVFSGDHHQLGIILAPDQQALYYVAHKPMHVFSYVRSKLTGLLSNQSGPPM